MPKETNETRIGSEQQPRPAGNEGSGLSALIRLRQIVEELRRAAERNDLEVAMAAAALLGPTMKQCAHLRDPRAEGAAEAAEMALEIHCLLRECETKFTAALRGVGSDMKRIQQGKRALAMARNRNPSKAPARILN